MGAGASRASRVRRSARGGWSLQAGDDDAHRLAARPDAGALLATVAAGILTYSILASNGREPGRCEANFVSHAIGWGCVVFALGWSLFLASRGVQLTPTGLGNRTAIASAIGAVAMLAAGLAGLAYRLRKRRRAVFAAAIALWTASGVGALHVIGSHFVAAAPRQREVLAGIHAAWPRPAAGSRLLLDGSCPYSGPAPVFDASWNLAGAIRWLYRDRTLDAGIVNERMAVTEAGVVTFDGSPPIVYPYPLVVFDRQRGVLATIRGVGDAQAYFLNFEPRLGGRCPPSRAGWGVDLL